MKTKLENFAINTFFYFFDLLYWISRNKPIKNDFFVTYLRYKHHEFQNTINTFNAINRILLFPKLSNYSMDVKKNFKRIIIRSCIKADEIQYIGRGVLLLKYGDSLSSNTLFVLSLIILSTYYEKYRGRGNRDEIIAHAFDELFQFYVLIENLGFFESTSEMKEYLTTNNYYKNNFFL